MTPITCPKCESIDWIQNENYLATDRNWLSWDHATQSYDFSFELKTTSDHNREPWLCTNNHQADDFIQELLDDRT